MSGPTREEVQAVAEELSYINWREARDAGESLQALNAYFGAIAAVRLESRYQLELAERKRASAADELQGALSAGEIALAPR